MLLPVLTLGLSPKIPLYNRILIVLLFPNFLKSLFRKILLFKQIGLLANKQTKKYWKD